VLYMHDARYQASPTAAADGLPDNISPFD
jgi:hypothetical protein